MEQSTSPFEASHNDEHRSAKKSRLDKDKSQVPVPFQKNKEFAMDANKSLLSIAQLREGHLRKNKIIGRCTFVKRSDNYLTFTLSDRTGDMQCKVFKKELLSDFSDIVKEGRIYAISNEKVKLITDTKHARASELEIVLNSIENLVLVEEHPGNAHLPRESKYHSIDQLVNLEPNRIINTEALVLDVSDLQEGDETKDLPVKRIIKIGDKGKQVELTLWGDLAKDPKLTKGARYRFKHIKITNYNVRSLSSTAYTRSEQAATEMDDENALNEAFSNLSIETNLTDLQKKVAPEKPKKVQFNAIVSFAHLGEKNKVYYIDNDTGKKKYKLRVEVQDPENKKTKQSCLLFDDAGKQLLGMSANKFLAQRREGGLGKILKEIKDKQYVFKASYGKRTYNGKTSVECTVYKLWEHTPSDISVQTQ